MHRPKFDSVKAKYCLAIIAFTICLLEGCQRDSVIPESSTLTQNLQKIETEYADGQVKVESASAQQFETFATTEMIQEVRSRILEYQKSFDTRYKVARNLSEGYPVGVIPAIDACPAGSEKVKFFMDNEDGGNSWKSGWTGAWNVDQNGNSWHTLCVVYGGTFRFMVFNKPTEYLLVRFGNNKSIYMEPRVWNVYIDNEDKNNKNLLSEGDLSPSFINSQGTNLQFWAISGNNTPGPNQDVQFPDLGFSYGVFGTFSSPVVGGAGGSGVLRMDDGNNKNANQLYSVDWTTNIATNASFVQGYGVDRTNDSGNTTFNIRRVR